MSCGVVLDSVFVRLECACSIKSHAEYPPPGVVNQEVESKASLVFDAKDFLEGTAGKDH